MNYSDNIQTIIDINKTIETLEDMVETLQFSIESTEDIPENSPLADFINAEENMFEKWAEFRETVLDNITK